MDKTFFQSPSLPNSFLFHTGLLLRSCTAQVQLLERLHPAQLSVPASIKKYFTHQTPVVLFALIYLRRGDRLYHFGSIKIVRVSTFN
jgi:hypothetical protein